MSTVLSRADLESYDPKPYKTKNEKRFLCPMCGDTKPHDKAHRCLSLNTLNGKWFCHRCGEKGLLKDYWDERPIGIKPRKNRGKAAVVRAFSLSPKTDKAEKREEASNKWRETWDTSLLLHGTAGAGYLESRNIPIDVADEAGVRFSHSWYGSSAVLFPIYDRGEGLVSVNGRFIDRNRIPTTQTGGSRGLGVFMTPGALLQNIISVTEAPIDALSLWQCGVNAIALLGTSWPKWLPAALAFKSVLVATDADKAGDEAAAKLIEALQARGARQFRLRPQGGKDWNELLEKHELEALRADLQVYSKVADDEMRVDTSWRFLLSGRFEEAEFIASLIEDAFVRETYRLRLRRELNKRRIAASGS